MTTRFLLLCSILMVGCAPSLRFTWETGGPTKATTWMAKPFERAHVTTLKALNAKFLGVVLATGEYSKEYDLRHAIGSDLAEIGVTHYAVGQSAEKSEMVDAVVWRTQTTTTTGFVVANGNWSNVYLTSQTQVPTHVRKLISWRETRVIAIAVPEDKWAKLPDELRPPKGTWPPLNCTGRPPLPDYCY